MNNTFHQTSELSTLIQNTRTQMKVELTILMPLNVVKHAVNEFPISNKQLNLIKNIAK